MQRRHMEFIAATINTIEDKEDRNKVAILFADAMNREGVNQHFQPQRFIQACAKDG
jgi:hypothetical protein